MELTSTVFDFSAPSASVSRFRMFLTCALYGEMTPIFPAREVRVPVDERADEPTTIAASSSLAHDAPFPGTPCPARP